MITKPKKYLTTEEQLPKTFWAFIWHFVKKQPYLMSFLLLTGFAWTLDFTIWPYIWKYLIDTLIAFGDDKTNMWHVLTPILLSALGFWIFLETMFRLQGFLMARLFPRIQAQVRMSMFSYIQGHSYQYFADHFAGDLANKISDMSSGVTQILRMLLTLFIPVCAAFIIATSLFATVQPWFAVILFIWLSIHVGICIAFANKCNNLSEIHAENRSSLSGRLVDSLTNMMNVKLFARKSYERQYLQYHQAKEQETHQEAMVFLEKVKILLGIGSLLLPGITVTLSMLYAYQQNMITIGEVVYINSATWNVMMMAWIAGLEFPVLFKEIGICRQALKPIQMMHHINDAPKAKDLQVSKGRIEFDQVNFAYHGRRVLFEQKNVVIEGGKKVGLVGFSGSGKTSFVHLILRFYDIDSGRILIDGQDIADVTLQSLRSQISMIPQDPVLFHRSLADNIRYGKVDATMEEVIEAAKKAHCHEFIMQLEDQSDDESNEIRRGYEVMVGERGIKLSGGQRQRIAIARAILKDAPILILDEATSALDSVTEREIQDSLEHLMANRTTIVVAHRLSTLAQMDRILVFDQGHIVEDGTHQQLLKNKNGHYARMWKMQADGFLPDKAD